MLTYKSYNALNSLIESDDTNILITESLRDDYMEFFQDQMKKYKIDSLDDLDENDLKKFFNEIKQKWEKGKGVKK